VSFPVSSPTKATVRGMSASNPAGMKSPEIWERKA
jgi:hypothetical protein